MPIYELECPKCVREFETYVPHYDSPNPECPDCKVATERKISKFKVVFTGDLSAAKYNDSKLEYANLEGHWGYRKRSSKIPGKLEPVWIDSWSKRKQFMKDEKLLGVEDVGNIEGSADGTYQSSSKGRGNSGQWI